MGERVVGNRQRRGRRSHEATGDRARPDDGHLLADHGAHCRLERIDAAGHPQARARRNELAEHGIAAERRIDRHRIRIEVEQPANAPDRRREVSPVGQAERRPDVGAAGLDHGLTLDGRDAVSVGQRQRPAVRNAVEVLDPADRSRCEERHRRAEVEWLAHGEVDSDGAERVGG